jgi:hypothetical protein
LIVRVPKMERAVICFCRRMGYALAPAMQESGEKRPLA